jgi:hypothetical protein
VDGNEYADTEAKGAALLGGGMEGATGTGETRKKTTTSAQIELLKLHHNALG